MSRRGKRVALHAPSPGPLVTVLCLAAPVVAAALFYTWTRVTAVRLGYALSRETATQRRLLTQQDALRLDVAALKSPNRLAKLASDRGLAPPTPDRILPLAPNGPNGPEGGR